MSVKAMNWVFYHARCSGNARVVLLAIADHADDEGRGARPSIATLAVKAGVSDRTVQRVLQQLRDAGELRWQDQSGPRGEHVYELVMGDVETPMSGGDNLTPPPTPEAISDDGLSPDAIPPTGDLAPAPVPAQPAEAPSVDPSTAVGGDNLSPGGVSDCHPSASAGAVNGEAGGRQQCHRGGDNSVTGGVTLLSPPCTSGTSCTSGTTAAEPPPSAPLRQTRTPAAATAPNDDGNYRVIEKLALEMLGDQAFASESEFVDAVKAACAAHRIDYGDQVPSDVVHRACASARIKRLKGRRVA